MPETPDEHLARLRAAYPRWQFWEGQHTGKYWAAPPAGHEQRKLITADSPAGLEAQLADIERRKPGS